jgi:hypothetical protein
MGLIVVVVVAGLLAVASRLAERSVRADRQQLDAARVELRDMIRPTWSQAAPVRRRAA